jgi:hypothetical protein
MAVAVKSTAVRTTRRHDPEEAVLRSIPSGDKFVSFKLNKHDRYLSVNDRWEAVPSSV